MASSRHVLFEHRPSINISLLPIVEEEQIRAKHKSVSSDRSAKSTSLIEMMQLMCVPIYSRLHKGAGVAPL
ncbi:hypothetical protein KSX_71150 [Ktedonospora formicarum]|uniref:Uncharacterized protein n=1 Tax=Ktedonospora formicarum TaxID=2778364 RepID=A0A8J3IAC6_9CHLR|nr:hypothetical protein KSX_71150 [Ktedonospora formicarum]